jgi:putative hydrolase
MLDIHEDYHVHSNYNDHSASDLTVLNALNRAEEIGLKTLAFTEHVRRSSNWIPSYIQEIRSLRKHSRTNVIIGFEAKILSDGSIDCPKICSQEYMIIASFHTLYRDKKVWMNALAKAVENPDVDIIGHLAPEQDFVVTDNEVEFLASKLVENNKIVEINVKYHRPPPKWIVVFRDLGVKFRLGSDAHSISEIGQFSSVRDLISLAEKN